MLDHVSRLQQENRELKTQLEAANVQVADANKAATDIKDLEGMNRRLIHLSTQVLLACPDLFWVADTPPQIRHKDAEIAHLEATVAKECEEREYFMDEVDRLRAQLGLAALPRVRPPGGYAAAAATVAVDQRGVPTLASSGGGAAAAAVPVLSLQASGAALTPRSQDSGGTSPTRLRQAAKKKRPSQQSVRSPSPIVSARSYVSDGGGTASTAGARKGAHAALMLGRHDVDDDGGASLMALGSLRSNSGGGLSKRSAGKPPARTSSWTRRGRGGSNRGRRSARRFV